MFAYGIECAVSQFSLGFPLLFAYVTNNSSRSNFEIHNENVNAYAEYTRPVRDIDTFKQCAYKLNIPFTIERL